MDRMPGFQDFVRTTETW